jgi:hypothetical protein
VGSIVRRPHIRLRNARTDGVKMCCPWPSLLYSTHRSGKKRGYCAEGSGYRFLGSSSSPSASSRVVTLVMSPLLKRFTCISLHMPTMGGCSSCERIAHHGSTNAHGSDISLRFACYAQPRRSASRYQLLAVQSVRQDCFGPVCQEPPLDDAKVSASS